MPASEVEPPEACGIVGWRTTSGASGAFSVTPGSEVDSQARCRPAFAAFGRPVPPARFGGGGQGAVLDRCFERGRADRLPAFGRGGGADRQREGGGDDACGGDRAELAGEAGIDSAEDVGDLPLLARALFHLQAELPGHADRSSETLTS